MIAAYSLKSAARFAMRFLIVPSLLVLPGLAVTSAQEQAQQPVSVLDQATQAEIQKFCTNIAEPARDQRYLLQKQELEKLQADVDQRIAVLEQRKEEYQDWLKRRNDFLQQAELNLIGIFKKMKPDAAAPQLEELIPEMAAAIVMKLPAQQSSLILSEMDPKKAAMVAAIMSSAVDPNTSKDPS